eukprot:1322005-Rhodomonas_salina.2
MTPNSKPALVILDHDCIQVRLLHARMSTHIDGAGQVLQLGLFFASKEQIGFISNVDYGPRNA